MEKRVSKDIYYLSIAEAASRRSTCLRKQWGAVIVANDQILSTGYNGSPRGRVNCIDSGNCYRITHNIPRGTCYETCLFGDCEILTSNGISRTIGQLARARITDTPNIFSVRVDDTSEFDRKIYQVHAIATTKQYVTGDCVQVVFENGHAIRCTADHEFLLSDFRTYAPASSLHPGDRLAAVHICRADMDIRHIDEYVPHVITVSSVNAIIQRPGHVYDLTVPGDENYAIQIGPNLGVFVHNCRSVHAEANAIISASRNEMIGSTMYMYGYDCETGTVVSNPDCCSMCKRLIINAGISKVIFADAHSIHIDDHPEHRYGYRVQQVEDWVTLQDDTNEEFMKY